MRRRKYTYEFILSIINEHTGFEDKTQGTLFFDVCRILSKKRPSAFMLENVKNLCSHDIRARSIIPAG